MVKYYYFYAVEGKKETKNPVITVALACNGTDVARGISICSPKDNFNYKDGRAKALARASWAMVSGCDVRPLTIGPPLMKALGQAFPSMQGKIEFLAKMAMGEARVGFRSGLFNPKLTAYERLLLSRPFHGMFRASIEDKS